jgi:hemolysin III
VSAGAAEPAGGARPEPGLRPKLRGWSHLAAVVPTLVLTVLLVVLAHGGVWVRLALAVYGLASVQLFAVSGVYHAFPWSPRLKARLRRIDHANIFVLVAATYTPICVALLGVAWMASILGTVWGIALIGIAVVVPSRRIPRWVTALCYVLQGWVAIVALPVIATAAGGAGLAMILVAGALYTGGAFVYMFRRPRLWPAVFGYHEIFHVMVIAANAVFAAFMVSRVASR